MKLALCYSRHMNKTMKGLSRIPRVGEDLFLDGHPVVVVKIFLNGNCARTIAVMDAMRRVTEVRKERLTKAGPW